MEVSDKTRRRIRLQDGLFYVLFLTAVGLAAWLSTRYEIEADWTASGRNTPAPQTLAVLEKLEGPVHITAFVTAANEPMRREIERLVGRYQRYKKDVRLEFVNPDRDPAKTREMGITFDGQMVVAYQGRQEKITQPTEQALTNTLQRLVRSGERWLVFVQGHGERDPTGTAPYDLARLAAQLRDKGIRVRRLNLGKELAIPDDTAVLVIASPQRDYLPGEVELIQDYVAQGGNLLWLVEPGADHGLLPLAESLGVELQPGVIVDPNAQILGIGDPRFALVADYPPHPITRDLTALTLFPEARALDSESVEDWNATAILETLPRSWVETGELAGEIRLDAGEDIPGPVTLGLALSRERADGEEDEDEADDEKRRLQRIVIIGDGDFLSDAYLGQGGNLELAMNTINWLTGDDQLIDIPAKTAVDQQLELTRTAQGVIGTVFLIVLPLGLLLMGLRVWWVRRRR